MPIYEYRCADCHFQKEYLQKVSEPPMSVCPSCGKPSLTKLLSAAGFHLKGNGWYVTDFKGGKNAKPAADAGSGTTAEGKSETKAGTETKAKTETKTETKAQAKTESGNKTATPAVT